MNLALMGWSPAWEQAFAGLSTAGDPARVTAEHRSLYHVVSAAGESQARLGGRFRHEAPPGAWPVVGDWVALDRDRIVAVAPRQTIVARRAAGQEHQGQVIAANVDEVWIVASLAEPLNPRRLERYAALAWDSGATPVVVLTKADLTPSRDLAVADAAGVAPGMVICPVSAAEGTGVESLRARLRPGRTVALLGPSGVGKSTLVNTLAGHEVLLVGEVGPDGRGRHTTTHRQLVPLAEGALLLDTPGMRELGLWDPGEGLDTAFADLASLAAGCRFADCLHQAEPGCAVTEAVEAGRLGADRLAAWHKLQREAEWAGAKDDPALARERERRNRVLTRAAEARIREKRGDG